MKLAAVMRTREGESHAQVAERVAALGFAGVSLGFDHRWEDAELVAIRKAFDDAGVAIDELRCYCNFITPRDDEAQRNRERLARALAAGAILDCDHAVTYAGSRSPDPDQPFAPHPDNWSDLAWETLVRRIWALLDDVPDLGVRLCFEPCTTTTLNSLENLVDLTADVSTTRVRIALDPVAVFSARAAARSGPALAEIFAVLADAIAVARATDCQVIEAGPEPVLQPVALGQGSLDYETYLKLVDKLQLDTPVVVKHQPSDDAYRAARSHLASASRRAGIPID